MRLTLARTTLAAALVSLALAGPVQAQTTVGVRVGASTDPDLFLVGAHVDSQLDGRLRFRPNVEAGASDGRSLIALNFEFAYRIPVQSKPFWVYVGAGPAANVFSVSERPGREGSTDVRGGFNVMLGLEHRRGLFGEIKIGAIDSPSVRLTIGWVFR